MVGIELGAEKHFVADPFDEDVNEGINGGSVAECTVVRGGRLRVVVGVVVG